MYVMIQTMHFSDGSERMIGVFGTYATLVEVKGECAKAQRLADTISSDLGDGARCIYEWREVWHP